MAKLSLFKSFARYYLPHKTLVALDIGSSLMRAILASVVPYGIKLLLDKYLPEGDLKRILIAGAIIMVLTVLMGAFSYINVRWGHVLGVRMEADMRMDIFTHLQKLSFNYFDRTKTGHIMSRISNDLTNIAEAAHHGPEDLLMSTLTLIGAFAFMFYINPVFAALCLIPLPLIVGWGLIFQGRMFRGFRLVRKKVADINSSVENSIQGIREVKSFANEDLEIDKFHAANSKFVRAREDVYIAMAGFHSGIQVLVQSYSILIVCGGAVMVYFGRAVVSDIITFYIYSQFIAKPIFQFCGFIEQFQQGASAFERFIEVMSEEPDIKDPAKPRNPKTVTGGIAVENLYFRYQTSPENEWVLKNINLNISAGKKIALVGESGAGKSTLASMIPRFYEAVKGQICIDGINIMELGQGFIRSNIGIVQQQPFLFDSTIRENILFGRPDADDAEVMKAAADANIADFIDSLPNKLDTEVGEHGVKLSGGQRQRIAIARVFLKNPPILIFDEATSSLDNESEELIRDAMERLCRDRTTIIIAHRLSTVKNADYTYVMRQGEVVEQGTHAELLEQNGYYFHLYSLNTF